MTGVAAAVASVPTKSTFFRVLIVRLAFCAEGVLTIPEGATPAATPRRLTRRDTLTAFGDFAAPPSHFGLTIGAQPRAGFARFDFWRRVFRLVGCSALLGSSCLYGCFNTPLLVVSG